MHEKGVFTGAYAKQESRFELAQGGCLRLSIPGQRCQNLFKRRRFHRILEMSDSAINHGSGGMEITGYSSFLKSRCDLFHLSRKSPRLGCDLPDSFFCLLRKP